MKDFEYESCFTCRHLIYDTGLKSHYCRKLKKQIKGNYAVCVGTDCKSYNRD